MAHLASNSPLHGMTGRVGNLVFKFYRHLNNGKGKVVVTRDPDMSSVKASPLQKLQREVFAEAVAYARNVKRDPEKKAAYEKMRKEGQTVFNAALSNYMKKKNDEMKSRGQD
jgi:hypothetical protein